MYTVELSKVRQRVLGFSGTLSEGSRARVPYTGQQRTPFSTLFSKSDMCGIKAGTV